MKNVKKLSKKQYYIGSSIALLNAEDHLSISKTVAEKGSFGFAVSHLILALEELAKASVLKLTSFKRNIHIKNLNKYFKEHGIKHATIIRLYLLSKSNGKPDNVDNTLSKELLNGVNGVAESKIDDNTKAILIFIVIILAFVAENINKNLGKMKVFDKMRNEGFYVDYEEYSDSWKSPRATYDREKYDSLLKEVEPLFVYLKSLFFSDSVDIDKINDIISKLQDENISLI